MSRSYPAAVVLKHIQLGFSLIELLVVVAIVAILAAVALPSYRNHVIKTNRSAAESFMSQVASKEEQVLMDMRNYVQVTGNANFVQPPIAGLNLTVPSTVSTNYNVSVAASSPANAPPIYVITAVPINPPQNDLLCQTLTLDSIGQRQVIATAGVAPTGSVAVCWQ